MAFHTVTSTKTAGFFPNENGSDSSSTGSESADGDEFLFGKTPIKMEEFKDSIARLAVTHKLSDILLCEILKIFRTVSPQPNAVPSNLKHL